jgi:hypothetical protein
MSEQRARELLVIHVSSSIARLLVKRYGAKESAITDEQAVVIARSATAAMSSFDGLMAVAEQWLAERYPADVQLVCDRDSPDPGPRLAAALRDCLEASS